MENSQTIELFKQQIYEDLQLIKTQWEYVDNKLSKPEYAFNYWVLSRIYGIDEEIITDYITEYNDKGIDCFYYFEETKELVIIQNKYYTDTPVTRSDVADFLQSPLSLLNSNKYKKSEILQNIFNKIKDDPNHKISLHFFSTSINKCEDIDKLVKEFNLAKHNTECLVSADFFDILKIYELYYGKNYKENINFSYSLGTINKGTFASLRDEYGIEGLYEAYYVVTPVTQIYKMVKAAEGKGYSLFEKNIRDYLGDNQVNNGIVETLRSSEERKNFIYYNNGITVICQKIKTSQQDTSSGLRLIPLVNPQIVNGCQTVSSIKKVLANVTEINLEKDYKNVYVMLKALVIDDPNEQHNKEFYNNVVKFTNKQNAISDKAFVSNMDVFFRLQEEFKNRGFLLLVRPSDKNKYKELLSSKEKADLIPKANATINNIGYSITSFSELNVPLEKLLQVFSAFIKTGYYAFTKKNLVLKQGTDLFDQYCSQIHNYITTDNMIKLYCLYKRAESERSSSSDKRTPIPYYVIGFLGTLIGQMTSNNIQNSLNYIFSDKKNLDEVYKYLVFISKSYKREYEKSHPLLGEGDYNVMIKKPIDEYSFKCAIDSVNDYVDHSNFDKWMHF